jgi:Ca-activated chloride channel family protein
MIPDGSGGFVKDERGAVVLSKLESGTLKELADATHGAYRDASAWVDLAGLINQTVNEGRKGRFLDKKTIRYVERFQWPLALALWCFLLSFCYEFPVQPRAREISLRAGGPSRSGAGTAAKSAGAALLLACIIGAFSPAPLHAAVKVEAPPASAATAAPPGAATPPPAQAAPEEAPPPGTPASLGRIVGRLAQQDTLSAPDLSELAHETVNWGRRIKEAGQPVPAGPVKDALAAVDELERRGDKLADWSQLRKELQALLERPPEKQEQKSPPQNQQQKNDDSQKKDQQSRKPEQQNQNQAQKPSANQDKAGSPQDRQDQKQSSNDQAKESSQSKSDQNQPNASPQDAKKKSDQPFAFGDMKKSPPPPPASSGTQKVGGADEKKGPRENADPALALPLQKLQEVRNHDSPGRLFQIMQAESNARSQKKPAKDW